MSLEHRYRTEKAKWDDIAGKHLEGLQVLEPGMDFHRYCQDEIKLKGVSQFLGNLAGKPVLEIGCGTGLVSVLLAKSGAHVTCFDLSPLSVQASARRAEINAVQVAPLVSAGEHLPFADEQFEIVFGKSILHHLDPQLGNSEVARVLRRGGKAVFVEPMGMNPVLTFVRQHVPYLHKNPVGVDRPLTYRDMDAWTQHFGSRDYREVQLLSMVERGFGWHRQFKSLRKLDDILLKYIPFLRRFCRYVVITAVK